jgi:hypothetical protein
MTGARPSGIAIGSYVDKTHNVAYEDAVYVSGGYREGSGVWVFGPTAPAHTLSVTKTGTGGGTVTSQPNGISCGSTCSAEYEEQLVNLYAVPDAHSDFAGWSVEGPNDEPCPGTGSCSVTIFGNTEVQAAFERPTQKTLEVSLGGQGSVTSEPAGIACPGHCTEEFAEGRTISLQATPAPHHRIANWSGCDSMPQADFCDVTMSEAKAVAVSFEPIPQLSLSVSKTGTLQGTVTSYPYGISCPGTCSASFDQGSTVYLLAAPSPGSGFGGFSGGGCEGTAPICAVPMSQAWAVGADFAPQTPPIEAPPVSSGRAPTVLPTPTLTLRKLPAKRGALLAATVSSAGWVSVLNPRLRRLAVEVGAAGTATLPLVLSGAGRAALRRSGHHRLRVTVIATFLPIYRGSIAVARTVVSFRAPQGAPSRRDSRKVGRRYRHDLPTRLPNRAPGAVIDGRVR